MHKVNSHIHWIIVGLMSLLAASSVGLCMNSVGVFYDVVSDSLGVYKGTFAFYATLSSLSTAVMSLFMVYFLKRYNYKLLLFFGMMLAILSTIMMAISHHVISFYLLGIMRGIAVAFYGMVPITYIIGRWFDGKHGVALSIALSFSGLSGALFSPLLSYCISSYGWRMAYVIMAIFIGLLVLPVLVIDWSIDPKNMGLLPYGYKEVCYDHVEMNVVNSCVSCLFVLGVYTLLMTSITGITQHLPSLSVYVGFTSTFGATMMSLVMFGNITSKLLIGILSDYLKPIKACFVMMGINLVAIICLYVGMVYANSILLLCSAFVFGSIYSIGAVGIPLITKYIFGDQKYVKVYPLISFLTSLGSSCSLTIIGYMYDFTHSYVLVIISAVVIHVINFILLMIIVIIKRKNDIIKAEVK